MDDAASVMSAVSTSAKMPEGEPNDDWTVEELIHWSLSQYQTNLISQTDQYVERLRDHCTRECEDITSLHTMAVEMSQNNENAPTSSTAANNKSPTRSSSRTRSDHIEVLITTGPHADSKIHLRPKPDQPCMIGRSKGKKFIKNGISLPKDQEVSTTHAKIVVEGMGLTDSNNGDCKEPRFYFVDVGSTNGSTLEGALIEPNTQVLLSEGLEIKVGGSILKFMLG